MDAKRLKKMEVTLDLIKECLSRMHRVYGAVSVCGDKRGLTVHEANALYNLQFALTQVFNGAEAFAVAVQDYKDGTLKEREDDKIGKKEAAARRKAGVQACAQIGQQP